MNKALHVFIYLFLILTGAALYFTYETFLGKEEMSDRNKALRDTIIEASAFVEKSDKYNANTTCPNPEDYKLDVSPTTAEWSENYTNPDNNAPAHTKVEIDEAKKDVLANADAYKFNLEDTVHDPLGWGKKEREELRKIYELVPMTGKPLDDGTSKMTADSDATKLLKKFVDALRTQKDQFIRTREAIPSLRKQIAELVSEVNTIKPQLRNERATVLARDTTIAGLNDEKAKLESDVADKKSQIEQLKTEVFSLRDEVTNARQETEAAKEELEKEKEMVAKLQKIIQDLQKNLVNTTTATASSEFGTAVNSIPAGDKGKILEADNDAAFAIIEITPEAMKELKGNDLTKPLPMLEFAIKRPGFNGPAGEIIGRVRLRQEVPGKNWIICDILSNWSQDKLQKNDTVFAD